MVRIMYQHHLPQKEPARDPTAFQDTLGALDTSPGRFILYRPDGLSPGRHMAAASDLDVYRVPDLFHLQYQEKHYRVTYREGYLPHP